MQPEGQDFEKNEIFEVFTLCGSNCFKIFLIESEKQNFWLNSGSKMLKSGAFSRVWKGMNSYVLEPSTIFGMGVL